jgi:hypothetical protein
MSNPIEVIRQRRAALRAAEAEEFRERAEANRKESARTSFRAAGGTDDLYFEQLYPSLRRRLIDDEILEGMKKKA